MRCNRADHSQQSTCRRRTRRTRRGRRGLRTCPLHTVHTRRKRRPLDLNAYRPHRARTGTGWARVDNYRPHKHGRTILHHRTRNRLGSNHCDTCSAARWRCQGYRGSKCVLRTQGRHWPTLMPAAHCTCLPGTRCIYSHWHRTTYTCQSRRRGKRHLAVQSTLRCTDTAKRSWPRRRSRQPRRMAGTRRCSRQPSTFPHDTACIPILRDSDPEHTGTRQSMCCQENCSCSADRECTRHHRCLP